MGIYSTATISRQDSLRAIRAVLDEATDEQLAGILFNLFADKTLFNFGVGWEKGQANFHVDAIDLIRSFDNDA